MAAAFVAARRTEGTPAARIAGAAGFLTLAGAEALHGAAVVGEASDLAGALRAGGYVLILGSALLVRRPAFAGLAFVGAPVQSVVPAAAAMAAGIAYGWRSPRDRGQLAIAAGLVMIGAGESFFAIPESGFPGAEFMSHLGRALGWGLVAAGVMSATRRSIRFRYVASFVAVLLVVILAVSSAITQVIGNNLRRETAARVSDEARALADRFEPEAVTAAQTAQGSAASVATALGDPEAVLRLSRILRRILQLDFVVVVDGSGEVITAVGLKSDAETFELAGSDVVAQAGATKTVSASVDGLGEHQLVVVGAAPFPPPLQGVMVVGFRLEDGLLGRLGPGTDAFIVRNRAVSASSLEGVDASTPLPADLVQRIEEVAIERGEQFAAPATINGVEYFVDVRPLLRTDGLVVGALVGTEPTEILAATEQGVYRVLFLVTLGAVAVAMVLSLVFGRRFTHPIRQLTIAARQVQAGDLTTKAPVSGEDEVGDLAVAFNRMTESLSSTTESLREAVEEEARLRDQLETVLDSMGDGLVAVDVSGRVVTLNPAAERIGGLVRSKSIGRPLTDVLVGRTAQGAALAAKENPLRLRVPAAPGPGGARRDLLGPDQGRLRRGPRPGLPDPGPQSGGGGRSREAGVPGHRLARAPDAADPHRRLRRAARPAGLRRRARRRLRARHPLLGSQDGAHRRHAPGLLGDRGRPDARRARVRRALAPRGSVGRRVARPGAGPPLRHPLRHRRPPGDGGRPAVPPHHGRAAGQRGQVLP